MATGGLLSAFTNLRPALLRYLSARGASPDEAEDIVQDVGVKLASERSGPVDQPRAYLYRMAHNHFLLHRRSIGRRTKREEAWVDVHTGNPPDADEQPSADEILVAREQLGILQEVIDSMPDRTRTIFRQFRIENVSQRDIAAEMDISVSAVEKHLARAYQLIAAERHRSNDEDEGRSRSLFGGGRGRHGN
ncbi:MAG TPA: sigma-70 family RNA polymerase sigma factor [Sphingobium sp.]|uniref:RNA polymerase sigma factor n=1 Tax=Sphingobium sp. TaxID=1912891 RepID=UPI002ED370A4